jgi:hypothetical protein
MLPNNLKVIGEDIFFHCLELATIIFPKGNTRDQFLQPYPKYQTQINHGDTIVFNTTNELCAKAEEAYRYLDAAETIEAKNEQMLLTMPDEVPMERDIQNNPCESTKQMVLIAIYAHNLGMGTGEDITDKLNQHFLKLVTKVITYQGKTCGKFIKFPDRVMKLCDQAAHSCNPHLPKNPSVGDNKDAYNKALAFFCAGIYSDEEMQKSLESDIINFLIFGLLAADVLNGYDKMSKELLDTSLTDFIEKLLKNSTNKENELICQLLSDIAKSQHNMGLPTQCILAPLAKDMPELVKRLKTQLNSQKVSPHCDTEEIEAQLAHSFSQNT